MQKIQVVFFIVLWKIIASVMTNYKLKVIDSSEQIFHSVVENHSIGDDQLQT